MHLLSYCSALIAAATVSAQPTASSTPLPPSKDPWYSAPQDFALASPGQILKSRAAPGNLSALHSSAAAYQILYRTTNSEYQPAWAVTTLFVPTITNSSALLSYQIAYNTANVDASPSYGLYQPVYTTPGTGSVASDIQISLDQGWYVNVPDFEGPLASFGLTVTEAFAVLDSIRAVKNLPERGRISNDSSIALWGYSNGALTSEFATEMNEVYAPDVQIAGAALGGLPPNLTYTGANLLSGTSAAGILPNALLGLTSQNSQARDYLLSQLHSSGPYNMTSFLAVQNVTNREAFPLFFNQSIWNYFSSGSDILQNPLIKQIMSTNGIASYHGTPSVPLFFYKAIHDEIGPIAEVDALYERYCDYGVDILYEKNTVGTHFAEVTNGDASAFNWLVGVVDGTYNLTGCSTRTVTINLTDTSGYGK